MILLFDDFGNTLKKIQMVPSNTSNESAWRVDYECNIYFWNT